MVEFTEFADINTITNFYLYGAVDTPESVVSRVRDASPTLETELLVDTVGFMSRLR